MTGRAEKIRKKPSAKDFFTGEASIFTGALRAAKGSFVRITENSTRTSDEFSQPTDAPTLTNLDLGDLTVLDAKTAGYLMSNPGEPNQALGEILKLR